MYSNTSTTLRHISQYLYFQFGLLNVLFAIVGGLTLFIALHLRQQSRFQIHRLLYGFAGYFFALAALWDLYRFRWLRPLLLWRFQNFALYQYTIITASLLWIIAVLLWFGFNFFLKRIQFDRDQHNSDYGDSPPDAPSAGAAAGQSDRHV